MSLIPIVIFIFGVFGLIWFRQQHIESWMRNQILAIISPFLLSFIVASATGINWYLLSGIVISISVWAWLFRFRFPSLYNQALQKTQAKAFDEAYQLLNQVIQEHPNLWEAYLLRSSVCLILGYFSHAERDAKKAVQLKPTTVSSYTSLGVVFLSQGLLEQAKQTFLEGFRLEPAVAATHINLGITCYRLGNLRVLTIF